MRLDEKKAMSEDITSRITRLEEGQKALRDQVSALREQVARLSGEVSQMSKRIDDLRSSLNSRIDDLRNSLNSQINDLRNEVRFIRSKLWWIMGILVTMWVTIVLAIILK